MDKTASNKRIQSFLAYKQQGLQCVLQECFLLTYNKAPAAVDSVEVCSIG